MPEEEKRENEMKENIAAFVIFGILFLLTIGLWNQWWGLFEPEANNPVVTTRITGDPVKGDSNAPITIVEYSDFECPFCGRWYRDVLPRIEKEYIDTGKVRLVYKQFPLTRIHPNAMPAAIASECIYRQGDEMFWQYHDLLYENQRNLTEEVLENRASSVGADMNQFRLCYSNEDTRPEVELDFSEGTETGVTSTPAFIIGPTSPHVRGELIIGAQPFETFEEVISRTD